MCKVAESTIHEVLLAALASPEHSAQGATQQDLLRATATEHACILHSLKALRVLHRGGQAAAESPNGATDPVSNPQARWRLAATPAPAATAADPERELVCFGNYRYSLANTLGRGRSGIVVRGENVFLKRDVALKFLAREYTDNESFKKRFAREARILGNVDHPNIVKVYDGGQTPDGTFYLAMEYVEGGTLLARTKEQGRLDPSLVADTMAQTTEGLKAAHELGIRHRDVKPENILMTPSGAKLTDFNLAAVENAALQEVPSTFGSVTSEPGKAPQMIGTLAYMAPEVANGERGSHLSDIYSLGATFYSVARGTHLFPNISSGPDSPMNWCWHHNSATPDALTDAVPGFPPDLWAIIRRCLEKDASRRYQSFQEILDDLAHVRGRPAESAKAAALPSLRSRRSNRRRALMVGLTAVLFLVLALLWVNHFAGAPKSTAKETETARKDEERTEPKGTPERRDTEPKIESRKTNHEEKKPEPEPRKEEPAIKPVPKPLAEQLAGHDPTVDDLALVRRLLELAARERPRLVARSYGAFRKGVDELDAEAPAPTEGERTFREWHLKAARDLADLADVAVASRLSKFTRSERAVSLVLTDGRTVSGEVKSADADAILISTDAGQERVPFANLAPSNFTGDQDQWKASFAFQALSGSATEALPQILAQAASSEDLLLWIPIVVRLAHEEARNAVARRDFARGYQLCDRLAALQPEIPRVFAHLEESDFKTIRDERDSLKLLLDARFADVATRYPETLAYGPAAEEILARFSARLLDEKDLLKKLVAVDPAIDQAVEDQRPNPRKIFEEGKTPPKRTLYDFVGGYASVQWQPQPPDPERKHWDIQSRKKIDGVTHPAHTILKHPTEFQRILYDGDETSASVGLVVVYRFIPGDLSARWRLGLESGDANRVYLQAAHDAVDVYRPALGEGAVDKEIARGRFDAPPDTQTWRSLTLVPARTEDGGVLLVYVDGNPRPVLRISLQEAKLPGKPLLGVFHGELYVKNLISPFAGNK